MVQVELLVMKALSLGLVKGSIDQVDKKVHMTWVQPRVLDRNQVTTSVPLSFRKKNVLLITHDSKYGPVWVPDKLILLFYSILSNNEQEFCDHKKGAVAQKNEAAKVLVTGLSNAT